MRPSSPLYDRILASIMLSSIFLITLLSFIVYYTNEVLESDFLDRQTQTEIRNLRNLLSQNPQAPLPSSRGVNIYLAKRQTEEAIPPYLLELEEGVHHNFIIGERAYHVLVTDLDGDRVYIQYDVTDLERAETLLAVVLAIAWVTMIIAVYFLARFFSSRLSEPVTRLNRELSRLHPDQRGVRLGDRFDDDEVGSIARAFDAYAVKMDDYVERQILFASMASHELRTPLSIVQSSIELIACDQQNGEVSEHIVKIQRELSNLADMLHCLLAVIGEKTDQEIEQSFQIGPLIDEIVEKAGGEVESRQIRIENRVDEAFLVTADKTLLNVALANLIGNAIKHSRGSRLVFQTGDDTLDISDSGACLVSDRNHPDRVSADLGREYRIGLQISKMICDHCGWTLQLTPNQQGGSTTSILFSPADRLHS